MAGFVGHVPDAGYDFRLGSQIGVENRFGVLAYQ